MTRMTLPPPPATVHFMGIGGIAMSGLARILLERGYGVSGCDVVPSRLTAELAAGGATVYVGHDPAHLAAVDLVVISAAVWPTTPELVAARAKGVPTVKAADLLGHLLQGLRTIAVAGTAGKTTTSALVATILLAAGYDPTAYIGGEVHALGGTVRSGRGPWAVAEADEYDERFLRLSPHIAIVTNVEADHLDYYGDLAGVKQAFAAFIALLPRDGTLIACADDTTTMELARGAPCPVVTYGLESMAMWRSEGVDLDADGATFTLCTPDGESVAVRTRLSGRHNASNTIAAIAAAVEVGVPLATAVAVVADFEPPRRRQEIKGHARGGAVVLDDYAHHPTKVRATLAGLRARYAGKRLRVAYQPHTYSRTLALLAETGASFGDADEVAVTEIYAAREEHVSGLSGRDVVAAVRVSGGRATFTPTLDDVAAWFARDEGPDVVLITMGAGDIWKAGEQVCVAP